ncbi:MAG: hypothetical protein GC165_07365 [Armatimonadetes bacterium]|nr:hypothetical protein [Armatimonadota bacterium]
MIKTKTVLVLGAGASIPYGFPSGKSLVEHILELDPYTYINRGVDTDTKGLQNLQSRLRKSGSDSIDLFIEKNPTFAEIAKIAIVVAITRCEEESVRRFESGESNWYQYLWSRMTEGAASHPDVLENDLAVITFNYDTSLENFLYSRYLHAYESCKPTDANLLLDQIPVLHVFGTTGGHPIAGGRLFGEGPYVGQSRDIFATSESLLTISEAKRVDSGHLSRIQEKLNSAERLVILGFGYHRENLDLLGLTGSVHGGVPARYFSAFNEPASRLNKLMSVLRDKSRNFSNVWPIRDLPEGVNLRSLDCLNFLIETSALIE